MTRAPERRAYPRSYLAGTARVGLGEKNIGHYFVQDASAGGALLAGGPVLPEGSQVRVLLRLSGIRDVRASGIVLREQVQYDGARGLVVQFLHISLAGQELIQQAVSTSLVRSNHPSVLVADLHADGLAHVIRDLDALECRSVLARSPLDVIRWLTEPDAPVAVALVGRTLGSDDGLDVIRFIAREFPSVRRVLMVPGPGEVRRYRKERTIHAVLVRPWRRGALAIALGREHVAGPAPARCSAPAGS
jgi:hypothetical protein